MEAACHYPYLYRLLRDDENPQINGITAFMPNAIMSVHEHVSGGSYTSSQYISTCATWEAVVEFASRSTTFPRRVATINAQALTSTGVGFIDLTTEEKRWMLLNDDRARNFARKFQEVLIVGEIPPSCIVQISTI